MTEEDNIEEIVYADEDFTIHDPEGICNGDPVVVYTDGSAIALGTGFEGYADLKQQLMWALQYGEPTRDIPPQRAEELHESEAYSVDIFTIAATLSKNQ